MIKDLKPREPIGAVLTIGVKGARGNPVDTDRFFLVLPQEVDGVRPLHPSFSRYNGEAADRRQMLRGNLVHATQDQCFEHRLRAQVIKGCPPHPARGPHCTGNGVKAERWDGETYRQIECPHDRCQWRQPARLSSGKDGPTPCKPWMRLLFRLRWPDGNPLPTPLIKWTSGSWNTTANILGFFRYIDDQARYMGISEFSLYGLPFSLTLTRKKRAIGGGRSFPVVSITPEVDLSEFVFAQRQRMQHLSEMAPPAALTDSRDLEEEAQDARSIAGPIVIDVPGSQT